MKEISLTKGYIALVDNGDHERVSQFKWCAFETGTNIKRVYGVRKTPGSRETNRRNIFLHRFILDAPRGVQVDHKNGDGLNCQRYNLRLATPIQNAANSRKDTGVSGYLGVEPYPKGRWRARIAEHHVGVFDTPEEAAHQRDLVAIEIWGEFAKLNFPESACDAIRTDDSINGK